MVNLSGISSATLESLKKLVIDCKYNEILVCEYPLTFIIESYAQFDVLETLGLAERRNGYKLTVKGFRAVCALLG
jgi:hypothetical protein